MAFAATAVAEDLSGSRTRVLDNHVRAVAIYAPRPDYPVEAWIDKITGHGVALLQIDRRTGDVTSVTMLQSTRHRSLDEAAVDAFRRWRFKPGTIARAEIPVRFMRNGFYD
jgi:TonB family protein